MKLKFKKQNYQTQAVEAVIDCFKGQGQSSISYRIDPGDVPEKLVKDTGFKNADIQLNEAELLINIQETQRLQDLPLSTSLVKDDLSPLNLNIEMETGTGKTYCYIKTMFEMNKRFGWNKFIVVVPSIAIREGVNKSLEITAEHFQEDYHKKAKFFIYNSKQLHNLESYSSDAGINIMIINVQAFNARGKDNRRIYEELDNFQSRRPIDVIKANRPILILDEPQKMEGDKTLKSLEEFKPLFILRYSATHKKKHNEVYRLDALDAYNQKLVKKIAVRGIAIKGLKGINAYLYLESIEISKQSPVARMELEVKQRSGIKRIVRKLKKGDNLFSLSGELDQYEEFVISEINANTDTVEFTNGHQLQAGEVTGDVTEQLLRRIQIRETIRAHLDKERVLFHQGIKVLSLFFIDEVAKYRLYDESGEQGGEYAQVFEQEYSIAIDELQQDVTLTKDYKTYVNGISVKGTHNGYFSIDKKSKHLIDPKMSVTERKKDEANDVEAYDLILKDKELLLQFEEPTRFIFSHSALREGWDNPNVFVICTLKHSNNTISRRQEVGRGLRIAVNQTGDRQDNPATVHDINVLTVVANESYQDFVTCLQQDISATLSERPRVADEAYFTNKILHVDGKTVKVTPEMATKIHRYLIKNDYIDCKDKITTTYHESVANQILVPLPNELSQYQDSIFKLVHSVSSDQKLPTIEDERGAKTNRLNDNFEKQEFKELWSRINRKAVYRVSFDSEELIGKCIKSLNAELTVAPLQYLIQRGEQREELSHSQLELGESFKVKETTIEKNKISTHSRVKYDLIGKIAENTQLTRKTASSILARINPDVFDQFKTNPENFIAETMRIIQEQKATVIIERLSYNTLTETYDIGIFTEVQSKQNFSKAGLRLKKHIYDYAITDSQIERTFVNELDTSSEVVVYAKLPRGFAIPTPVGNYNPDWAIAFEKGAVKHIYFVAETKGTLSSMQLRKVEKDKIRCARKFFEKINTNIEAANVKYDVIDSYAKLMKLVV